MKQHITHLKVIVITLLFCLPTINNAQTNFSNLGASDSGGIGYKTVATTPILALSGTMRSNGTSIYSNSPTWTIIAYGAEDFTFEEMEISGRSNPTFYSTSSVTFKDKNGVVLQTMTLDADKTLATDIIKLSDFFDNNTATPIVNVAEITFNLSGNGGAFTNCLYETITVSETVSNAAPIVTAPSAPTVKENDSNVVLADNIHITDADGDNQTVSFTITGGTLAIGTSGITFGNNGNGSDAFTAQGTLTDINNALDAATFTPTPDLYGNNAGTIAFTSNDATVSSTSASVSFNITEHNIPTSIGKQTGGNLSIYPNPFVNQIYLTNNNLVNTVTISDISGKQVKRVVIQGGKAIDVSDLQKGIHIITVEDENGNRQVFKTMKK